MNGAKINWTTLHRPRLPRRRRQVFIYHACVWFFGHDVKDHKNRYERARTHENTWTDTSLRVDLSCVCVFLVFGMMSKNTRTATSEQERIKTHTHLNTNTDTSPRFFRHKPCQQNRPHFRQTEKTCRYFRQDSNLLARGCEANTLFDYFHIKKMWIQ